MPPVRRRRHDYDYEHNEREEDQEMKEGDSQEMLEDDDMPQLVEHPATPMQYTFFTEMTPLSFNPSPATQTAPPPSESKFNNNVPPDTASSPPTPQRASHGKRRDASYIPRPPNAFILFRSSFIKGEYVPERVEGSHSNLSKIVGMYWRTLPPAERTRWETEAAHAQLEHRKRYPDWRFRPAANALAKLKVVKEDSARRRRRGGAEGAEVKAGPGMGREFGGAGPSRPRKRRDGASGCGKDPPGGDFMFVDTELGKGNEEAVDEDDEDKDVDMDMDIEVWNGKGKGKAKATATAKARRVSPARNDMTTSAEASRPSPSSSTPQHASYHPLAGHALLDGRVRGRGRAKPSQLLDVLHSRGRVGTSMSSSTPSSFVRSASSSFTTRSAITPSTTRRSSISFLATTAAQPTLKNKPKNIKTKTKTRTKPEPAAQAHDDARLVQIAEYLREGKTGAELERAVGTWERERVRASGSGIGGGDVGVGLISGLSGDRGIDEEWDGAEPRPRARVGGKGAALTAEIRTVEIAEGEEREREGHMKCEEELDGDANAKKTSTSTLALSTTCLGSSYASSSDSASTSTPTPRTATLVPGVGPTPASSLSSTFAPAVPKRLGLAAHDHAFTTSVSSSPITFSVPLRTTSSASSGAGSTFAAPRPGRPQIHVHARRADEEEGHSHKDQIHSPTMLPSTAVAILTSTPTSSTPPSSSAIAPTTTVTTSISISTRVQPAPSPLLLPQHRTFMHVHASIPPRRSPSPGFPGSFNLSLSHSRADPRSRSPSRDPAPSCSPTPLSHELPASSSVPLTHMFKRSMSAPVPAPGSFTVFPPHPPPPLEHEMSATATTSPTVPLSTWQRGDSHIPTTVAFAPTPFSAASPSGTASAPLTPLSAIPATYISSASTGTPASASASASATSSPHPAPRFTLPWQDEEDRRRVEVDAGYAAFWWRPLDPVASCACGAGEVGEGEVDEYELGVESWGCIMWDREGEREGGEGMHEIVREGSFGLPLDSAALGVGVGVGLEVNGEARRGCAVSSEVHGGMDERFLERFPPLPAHQQRKLDEETQAQPQTQDSNSNASSSTSSPVQIRWGQRWDGGRVGFGLPAPTHAAEGGEFVFPVEPYPPPHPHTHAYTYPSSASTPPSPHALSHHLSTSTQPENQMLMAGAHFYPALPTPISPYSSSFSSLAGWNGDSVRPVGGVSVKPGSRDGEGWGAGGIQSSGLHGGGGCWEVLGKDMQYRHGDHADG